MLQKGELEDVETLRHPTGIGVSTRFGEGEGEAPLPRHGSTKADLGQLQKLLVVPPGDVVCVLREEALIQEGKERINRGPVAGRSRRKAKVR